MRDASARTLIEACAASTGAEAWEEFRRRFESRMRTGVVRAFRRAGMAARPETIDDLVQESYCRLLEHDARALTRCASRGEAGISAYLRRVAERRTLDYLRAEAAVKRGAGKVDSLDEITDRRGRSWLGVAARAEHRLLLREVRQRLVTAWRRAPAASLERNVRIFRLAFIEGLTSREISRQLGNSLSVSGVDAVLHRARKRLEGQGLLSLR
jgi:RNA polymerase sigma factor (sigma-70 family)